MLVLPQSSHKNPMKERTLQKGRLSDLGFIWINQKVREHRGIQGSQKGVGGQRGGDQRTPGYRTLMLSDNMYQEQSPQPAYKSMRHGMSPVSDLPKQALAAATCRHREVDIDVVILSVHWFLHKWTLKGGPIHFYSILILFKLTLK